MDSTKRLIRALLIATIVLVVSLIPEPSATATATAGSTIYGYDVASNSSSATIAGACVGTESPTQLRVVTALASLAADRAGFVAAEDGADEAGNLVQAACGGESFSPDTQVVMADGSKKALDQVKVGDKVEGTDTKTGKTTAKTVTTV